MLKSLFFFIACLCLPVFALEAKTLTPLSYTPGPTLQMTGSYDGVSFGVHTILSTVGKSGPTLDSATMWFHGVFHLADIGWVEFSTGSYQVQLDCTGVDIIRELTPPYPTDPYAWGCTLSGTAWSENYGDIIFDRKVKYAPSLHTLSGSIDTLIGRITFGASPLLRWPFLAYGPDKVVETSPAQEATTSLLIQNSLYHTYGTRGGTYQLTPLNFLGYSRSYNSVANGSSTQNVLDTTQADTYEVKYTSADGSVHTYEMIILPRLTPSTSISGGNYLRKNICTAFPTHPLCPDGATLLPTTHTRVGNNLIADGKSFYDFSLIVRDRYGNRINSGSVLIRYDDRLKDIREAGTDASPYASRGKGYAVTTSGALQNLYDGTLETPLLDLALHDTIRYGIAAKTPTTATSDLRLDVIEITDRAGNLHDGLFPRVSLTFLPWYTSSLTSVLPEITISTANRLSPTLLRNGSNSNPTARAIYGLAIGSNATARFSNFSSATPFGCIKESLMPGANECGWSRMDAITSPVIVSSPGAAFTGVYIPYVKDPSPEPVRYASYVTYVTDDGTRILYPSASGPLGTSVYGNSPVKILGQNNAGTEFMGVTTDQGVKIDFWNTVRKNIALLERNVNTDTVHDVRFIRSATGITMAHFAGVRTIIVRGVDVTIDENIIRSGTAPLALIATMDANGNGGNIRIDPSVTDIEVSLVAEKSIFTSGDNQLMIYGSVISENTMGDTVANICPYYVQPCVNPERYDFEEMRVDYTTLSDTTGHRSVSPGASLYPTAAIILQSDPSVSTNPPPGLSR